MKYHLETDQLLKKLGVSALKRYGQNFLIHTPTAKTMVEAAKIKPNERVLEIGPGLGALTQHISFETNPYISFEIDRSYHQYLLEAYPTNTNHLLGNFLKSEAIKADVILGNLPYYATTEMLEKIYKDYSSARVAVLMIQREVIARLIAPTSSDHYGPLAIMTELVSDFSLVQEVSKVHFYPEPHVVSSIFKLTFHQRHQKVDRQKFFYFIKKMFLHRRKTILNNLMPECGDKDQALSILSKAGINPQTRPEDIDLNTFIRLFNNLITIKSI
jgi:16S rRNA (adenine1518-N6/adenine1519-N6)-dimethyltransferase